MITRITQKDLEQAWTDFGKTHGGVKNDCCAGLDSLGSSAAGPPITPRS